jgi:putative MATE family efflux protein
MAENLDFGKAPLSILLRKQALPASIGILVMSVYGIIDTIFVGRYVGALGIGAITVVLPITFLISSIGMAIGIGGSSIISRSFGEDNPGKAHQIFGNQITLTLSLAIFFVLVGWLLQDEVLELFGGRGAILAPAVEYFQIILVGAPFLAWAMMSNTVIRAEGHPRIAMFTMIVPAITNLILDPLFIIVFEMGLAGAAWATTISYIFSAVFTAYFFVFGPSDMRLSWNCVRPQKKIIKEIAALGSVTMARQGTISILSIVLNNSLYSFGGELSLAAYGIVSRVLMFANFPVLGISQGFLPIVGFNFGAKKLDRVSDVTRLALSAATIIAGFLFLGVMIFTHPLASLFSNDPALLERAVPAIRMVFLATPLLATSLMGSAFFQAIGQARLAMILALSKQGFLLIPLLLILPHFIGINGIWYSFPIADVGAAIISVRQLSKSPYVQMPWQKSS